MKRPLVILLLTVALSARPAQRSTSSIGDIQNIFVIIQENWSFDSLYGLFPGANGIQNADEAIKQIDPRGKRYPTLPQPLDTSKRPPVLDPRFPVGLPMAPFDLSKYVKPNEKTGDLIHRYYQQQLQINKGKMNRFIAWSDAGGLVMSYYDARELPEGKLAQEFTLADNFFHAAFGGSFLNHQWLICACTPKWTNAPKEFVAQVKKDGTVIKDGMVTPDGFVVNQTIEVGTAVTAQPFYKPYAAAASDSARRVPPQTALTIGDRLNERNIAWRWYAGGFDDAMAGRPDPTFQFHHQPFAYYEKYADGTENKAEFLKDEKVFYEDLKQGKLPSVSFIKLLGLDNEHPGYASILRGQERVAEIVTLIRNSPYWMKSAIFILYDENGGRWDHVPPPKIDRWGPGVRVPAIIVSPYAKKGYVDHTPYDTTSVMAFIERRWNLRPIATRDAAANDLTAAFEFGR